ncbi:MAG: protein phosphatase 2C domain-containing protein [Acidobacteria bacterium]|nr:protein phosphatase 2C domain-containing protein [Acidobacteriota bacterium]
MTLSPPALNSGIRPVASAGATDPGLIRANNEDRFGSTPDAGYFFVVDGVGGQAAGEIAAQIAADSLSARLHRRVGTPERRVREAITIANNNIFARASENPEWSGMACVLTVAVLEQERLTIGQVGDTRLYLITADEQTQTTTIHKVTHDHSPVGELEDAGDLTEQDAMLHPDRNQVNRQVGIEDHTPDDEAFIEITEIVFPPSSALVLCSDGLSDVVTSDQIRSCVQESAGNPHETALALITAANAEGGKDNITVVVVEGESFSKAVRSQVIPLTEVLPLSPPVPKRPRRFSIPGWLLFVFGVVVGIALSTVFWKRFPVELPPKPISKPVPVSKILLVGPDRQFATISEALLVARAGDTISVAPGEYREQVKLKNGVTVISEEFGKAVILPTTTPGAAVIAEQVSNARFAGFKILGEETTPLAVGLFINGGSLEVEDLEISQTRQSAIEMTGNVSSVLRANYLHDNAGNGIVVRGPAAVPRLIGNIIVTVGRDTPARKTGIVILDGAAPRDERNLVTPVLIMKDEL